MLKKFRHVHSLITNFFKKNHYEVKEVFIDGKDFLIRKLKNEDIKYLLDLEREVYEGHLPWTKSAFISEFHSGIPHLYIGIFQGRLTAGFIGCRIIGLDAHITNVAVKPSFQGQGIGTLLIEEIEKFAVTKRCETITLEVRISNIDAQRLYRRLGFVSRTIKHEYYNETNEDALDMVKYLKSE